MLGVVNFAVIDTTPGADNAFAPPEGFSGDYAAYKALLRERYACDLRFGQHIACVALNLKRPDLAVTPSFIGPYAKHADWIARQIGL